MTDRTSTALDRVYAARTPGELTAAYAGWAAAYDRETAALGYCLPFLVAAWVARLSRVPSLASASRVVALSE